MDNPFSPSPDVVPASLLVPRQSRSLRGISRWLYTQNPFYLLSAWLVFFGLRWSFGPGTSLQSSAALFAGLLIYTLLLAAAAFVVVRIARVWDDARSMLLLVVLMFVGTSVALDETLVARPEVGRYYYLAAWAVAANTTEAVLRGIRLRLAGFYRLVYHALLALFYAYPVALTTLFTGASDPRLLWLLFSFTPVAAGCFALLWPALRRGAEYVRENGSPWPWPLFPWSLFVILAVCVAGRAYYLCLSFHFVGAGDTIFGPYFLLPLVWVLAALWMYGAARGPWMAVAQALLLAPPLWVLMSSWHASNPVYHEFLDLYLTTFGVSPLYVALWSAIVYYLYARWLAVGGAEVGMTISLAAVSLVEPASHVFSSFSNAAAWPWLAAALWQGWFAVRRRSSGRTLVAAMLLSIAVSNLMTEFPTVWRLAAVYHLLLIVILALGYLNLDDLGRWLCRSVAPLGFLGCLAILWRADDLFPGRALELQIAYGGGMSLIALAFAGLVRQYVFALAAACILCGTAVLGVWPWYARTRTGSPGLDYLLLGVACLLLGLGISFAKGGYFIDSWRRLRKQPLSAAEEP